MHNAKWIGIITSDILIQFVSAMKWIKKEGGKTRRRGWIEEENVRNP